MFFAFPLDDLLDEDRCYRWLMERRWPGGRPVCPRCGEAEQVRVHSRDRAPVENWRCQRCRRVFNVFAGTIFQWTRRACSQVILILQAFSQGKSTSLLARELECEYDTLLELRHRWQAACADQCFGEPGFDKSRVTEMDEMYQNSGEKRHPSPRARRPAAAAGQQGAGARHV